MIRSTLIALVMPAIVALPLSAGALPIALTLDTSANASIQQALNTPCVIGNPSCNNPAGFDFTLLPVNPPSPDTQSSPTYTVGQIRTVLGGSSTFSIGVDISQAPGQAAYSLSSFTVNIAGGDAFQYLGPTLLTSAGNGFADALLNTVDLTQFAGSASVIFTLNYGNQNGAREQFFLISGDGPPAPVPEPATLLLFGTTMAGLGLARRRWRRSP